MKPIAIALVFLTAFSAYIYWNSAVIVRGNISDTHLREHNSLPFIIRTSHPKRTEITDSLRWTGSVKSINIAKITSPYTGKIMKIYIADNAKVKRNQPLFKLGGIGITNKLKQQTSQIDTLTNNIKLTRQMMNRKRQMVTQHLLPADELSRVRIKLSKLRESLNSAQLQLDTIKTRCTIKSPIAGRFINRQATSSQLVTQSEKLAEVINPNHLRIVARVFTNVNLKNCRAEFVLNQKTISGIVTTRLPQNSPEGASLVWIESKQINNYCHPEQRLSGTIILQTRSSLVIPVSAIVRDEDENPFVFVENAGGKYIKQKITTSRQQGNMVEVVSGLKLSENVVTEGAYELFFGHFSKIYKVAD